MDVTTLRHYCETTFLVLLLCFAFSSFVALLVYERANLIKVKMKWQPSQFSHVWLPSLVIAPLVIFSLYKTVHWYSVFPVSEGEGFAFFLTYSILPALLLFFASGMASTTIQQTKIETHYWLSKPFARVTTAFGLSAKKNLRKLVLLRALSMAWATCLPWVFCELILIEVIFNVPGLGLDIWNSAKIRDRESFLVSLGLMLVFYLGAHLTNNHLSKWIGQKLDSYI